MISSWLPIFAPKHESQSCCSKLSSNQQALQVLDKVCRIALAVLSYLIAPIPFMVSFGAGLLATLSYDLITKGNGIGYGNLKPVCGQGYMEFLSGRTYPAWTVHVVTTAFVGAHVRHDPLFYVPFCGLFTGVWVADEVASCLLSLSSKTFDWWRYTKPVPSCPCC